MKKYKLIQEYPGSPKLGSIAYNGNTRFFQVDIARECKLNIPKYTRTLYEQDVENSPKHWEEITEYPIGTKVLNSITNTIYTKKEDGWYRPSEKTSFTDKQIRDTKAISVIDEKVVEKEYEILSLKDVRENKIYSLKDNGNYSAYDRNGTLTLEQCLFYKNIIYSIKRLSDGEIFTIGDKISYSYNYPETGIITKDYTIEKIYFIQTPRLGIYVGGGLSLGIKGISKTKQPLFTTEDGVEIFEEGIQIFTVDNNFNSSIDKIKICKPFDKNYPLEHWYKGTKIFSTIKAGEDYILMNKPIFTATDVLLYLDIFGNIVKDVQKERVKTIAKSKL